MATEQLKYETLDTNEIYEIRKYSDRLVIETETSNQNSSFRKLFNYISGSNENNQEMLRLIEKINDKQTRIIANTEREVLKILEGDCDTAIGVFATIKNNKIELTAELFSVDGKSRFFIKEDDDIENHMILAKKIAGDLKIKSKGSYKG